MQHFIFLDDFLVSGKTEKTVVSRLQGSMEIGHNKEEPRCRHVGTVLYENLRVSTTRTLQPTETNSLSAPRWSYEI
jgi:hypothetical protein